VSEADCGEAPVSEADREQNGWHCYTFSVRQSLTRAPQWERKPSTDGARA